MNLENPANYTREEWALEAAAIAKAFGVIRPRIIYDGLKTRLVGRIPLNHGSYSTLFFRAHPEARGIEIEVKFYWNGYFNLSSIWLKDGSCDGFYGGDNEKREYMTKGAFKYGYTAEQIEKGFGLGLTITAHQQLEWALEASGEKS